MKSLLVQVVGGTLYCLLHSKIPQELNLYNLKVERKNTAHPWSAVGTMRNAEPASASCTERIKEPPALAEGNNVSKRKKVRMILMSKLQRFRKRVYSVKIESRLPILNVKITDSPVLLRTGF